MKQMRKHAWWWAGLLMLAGCHAPAPVHMPIAPPWQSGELVVATRNGPATRYEDANGQMAGLENDLLQQFAHEYNYRLRFVEAPDVPSMLDLLHGHQVHLVAGELVPGRDYNYLLQAGPGYLPVSQQVVYNTDGIRPANLAALQSLRLATVAGTWHVDALRDARLRAPALRWQESRHEWGENLLDQLSRGALDAVVVDSSTYDLVGHLYPNLDVAFDMPGPASQLAWWMPRDASPLLQAQVRQFFRDMAASGRLKQLSDRYYGYAGRLEGADVSGFLQRMNTVLPRFRKVFEVAQQITGLDWRLLAAISYQESHWDPLATSPTGVRGMMMMTSDTADRMGVTDRLDPRQSVLGGARYLLSLLALQPARTDAADRIWMALAAYNQGESHLDDARLLASRKKLNPLAWCDVKQTLPLLSGGSAAAAARHGYCRGGEAVIFVDSIRTYYDILQKYEPAWQPAPLEAAPEQMFAAHLN